MTVSAQVIDVLDAICEKFGIAIDWTAANVLPYVQELAGKFVSYEVATSIAWIILAIIPAATAWILCYVGYKKDIEDLFFTALMAGFFFTVGAVLIIAIQAFDLVACGVFPEKILLREIKEFLAAVK